MALHKLRDFDPNYQETLGGNNIIGFNIYVEKTDEKVGTVADILLDDLGHFRYLVVDFGLWIFNKVVLLPIGFSCVEHRIQRVYVLGLTKKQVEDLPEYNDCLVIDHGYEEQVRGVYRPEANAAMPLVSERTPNPPPKTSAISAQTSAAPYNYQQDPALYELNDQDHQILKQYQNQLLVNRRRANPGEAALSQQVGAEVDQREAPVEQAQVRVERSKPVASRTTGSDGEQATRSACLIFNPVAGQSDPEQDLATIQALLEAKINLDIRTTTPDVNADQLAHEAVERGAELIIASGGDGTLSTAAAAVVGTGIPLGVISRGTANAFATAMGIPSTIEAACQTILEGTTRVVDAAYCNGKPMVLLAGIGFEAETVERADRKAKNRFGMLAYVLAGVQELSDFKPFEARIETEDKVITCEAVAVTVANAAPRTSVLAQGPAELIVDDGLLDVTIVAPANRVGAIAAVYNLLQTADSDATTNRSDTGYLRAKNIKVTTDPPQEVVLDGELVGHTPVEIECVPGGLTVLVPARPEEDPTEKLEGLPNLRIEPKASPPDS